MTKRIPLTLAAAFAALALSTAVHAESGFGVGASVGASQWKTDGVSGYSLDKNDVGYKLYVNYGFNPFVSLEGGYANLGQATLTGQGITSHIKGDGAYVDLVGTLPLPPLFAVFGKVGAFNGHAKVDATYAGSSGAASDSGTDVKVGLGVQATIAPFMRLRGEWERYRFKAFGSKGDVDLFSVGLGFQF